MNLSNPSLSSHSLHDLLNQASSPNTTRTPPDSPFPFHSQDNNECPFFPIKRKESDFLKEKVQAYQQAKKKKTTSSSSKIMSKVASNKRVTSVVVFNVENWTSGPVAGGRPSSSSFVEEEASDEEEESC
jgi:hypothetical protein